METSNKKRFIFVSAVFVVIAIMIGFAVHEQSLSAKLTITAVPSVSHITVNGKSGRQGINKVQPGTKKIAVSLTGFSTVTQTLIVKRGDNKSINVVLSSNSNETSNWYLTHPGDERTAEGISSHNNDALASQSLQSAPLIRLLPFVGGGLEFRVDYGNAPGVNNGLPVIYVTAPTPPAQQNGINWIKSLGYNPSDYKIDLVAGTVKPLNP